MRLEQIKDIHESESEGKDLASTPAPGDTGQLITSAQAAVILDVDQSRIRQFVADGRLTSHKPTKGRRDHFFKLADVRDLAKKDRPITGRPDEGKGFSKDDKKNVKEDFSNSPDFVETAEFIAELITEDAEKGEHTHEIYDRKEKKVCGKYKCAKRARTRADKLDNEYGAYRYGVRRIGSKDA